MPRSRLPRIALSRKSLRYTGLACGAVSIGVVGALLLGPSPVTPGAAPKQDPPEDSIVGKRFEDVATAELTGANSDTPPARFAARQVIVRFESEATSRQRADALASIDGRPARDLPIPNTQLVKLIGANGVEGAYRELEDRPTWIRFRDTAGNWSGWAKVSG